MTPDEVRAIIDQAGTGNTFTDRLKDICARTSIAESTMWKYVDRKGVGIPARSRLVIRTMESLKSEGQKLNRRKAA